MTHDKIFQHRASQENQYGNCLSQGIPFYCRGCGSPVSPIRDIKATGVSICEGGRVRRQTDSSAGSENCLHGQALPESYAGIETIYPAQGTNVKRSGNTGLGGFSQQRSETWFCKGEEFAKLSWNTALTDCSHEKSGKYTKFSSRIKHGSQPLKKL